MKVSLQFRLYMMRYGMARLVAAQIRETKPSNRKTLKRDLVSQLTREIEVSGDEVYRIERYLAGKPGSPRYTPVRQQLEKTDTVTVEQQDYWLSDPRLSSSVGALSKNYYEDPIDLAQILGLVKPGTNRLLSRGQLVEYVPGEGSPFLIPEREILLLALWLLRVDGDWIWALLRSIQQIGVSTITVDNRVEIFLEATELLLSEKQMKEGGSEYLKRRKRIIELRDITQRNRREGLNLGQPWSWFLIPRLELLVDADILCKQQPDQLTGYSLSDHAITLSSAIEPGTNAKVLIDNYFSAYAGHLRETGSDVNWAELRSAIEEECKELRSPTDYYPLFECAVVLCANRVCERSASDQVWNVGEIVEAVKTAARDESDVVLGMSRYGGVESFKIRKSS